MCVCRQQTRKQLFLPIEMGRYVHPYDPTFGRLIRHGHIAASRPKTSGSGSATHRKRKHDPTSPHSYHVMFLCLLTSHRRHAYTQKHPSGLASELACHASLSTCVSGAWRKTAVSWKSISGASRLGSSPMFDADGTREYQGKRPHLKQEP
jgi:hypothetical protein